MAKSTTNVATKAVTVGEQKALIQTKLTNPWVQDLVGKLLPKHLNTRAEQFIKSTMWAALINPEIVNPLCDTRFLIRAVVVAARLGLPTDGLLGLGYIVPFKKWGKVQGQWKMLAIRPQFIPGYKGLINLAYRSNMVDHVEAHPVFEGDTIEVIQGSHPEIIHVPDKDRDRSTEALKDMIGCYSMLFRDGERISIGHYMNRSQLDERRDRSPSKNKSGGGFSGPWNTDPLAMYRKIPIRDGSFNWPLSPEDLLRKAIAVDDAAEGGRSINLSALGIDPGDVKDPGIIDAEFESEEDEQENGTSSQDQQPLTVKEEAKAHFRPTKRSQKPLEVNSKPRTAKPKPQVQDESPPHPAEDSSQASKKPETDPQASDTPDAPQGPSAEDQAIIDNVKAAYEQATNMGEWRRVGGDIPAHLKDNQVLKAAKLVHKARILQRPAPTV